MKAITIACRKVQLQKPEVREKYNAAKRLKYATDPAYRAKRLAETKASYERRKAERNE